MLGFSRFLSYLPAFVFSLLLSPVALSQVFSTYGVQYPVWIERGDERIAVGPGVSVMAGDVLATGGGGKAWVTMADGALVKLGENGSLRANSARTEGNTRAGGASVSPGAKPAAEVGVIEGSFDVLEGAFRYTTEKLNKVWQRDIEIGLGQTTTVGIRGTDLWGRVDSAEQFVVLLEGIISVKPKSGGQAVELKTPLEIYTASNQNVSTVEMSAVQALAPETELDFGDGVQVRDGAFVVHLASYESQSAARAARDRLSAGGLSTSVTTVDVSGGTWHRLTATGLKSLADAQALAARAGETFGFESPWAANR